MAQHSTAQQSAVRYSTVAVRWQWQYKTLLCTAAVHTLKGRYCVVRLRVHSLVPFFPSSRT